MCAANRDLGVAHVQANNANKRDVGGFNHLVRGKPTGNQWFGIDLKIDMKEREKERDY
jgi:hypothetical protein